MRDRRQIVIGMGLGLAALLSARSVQAQLGPARPELIKQSKTVAEALSLAGVANPELGRRVLLEVPDIVVTGQMVDVRVLSRMPGTDWIMLLQEGLGTPVLEVQEFTPGEERSLTARFSVARTTRVRAIVRSAGRFFAVSREVKVATATARP